MGKAQLCSFCEQEATHLCDYAIAKSGNGADEIHTCDVGFCTRHGKTVGHICVRGRVKGRGCFTIDYCSVHARAGLEPLSQVTHERLIEIRADIDGMVFSARFGGKL